MPRRKAYICDVCGLRFLVNPEAHDGEREERCPRCRATLVRPAPRRYGRSEGNRQSRLYIYRSLACG